MRLMPMEGVSDRAVVSVTGAYFLLETERSIHLIATREETLCRRYLWKDGNEDVGVTPDFEYARKTVVCPGCLARMNEQEFEYATT